MSGVDPVTLVALVISLVALAATFMQVLQQYYSSAAGYSQCNEKVMGRWETTKSRRFSWAELRFEVTFQVPVIFVSPPTNSRGPIWDAPIYFLDGTPKSLEGTWTQLNSDIVGQRENFANMSSYQERIPTTYNERASWIVLLSAVQRMEKESREWQLDEYKHNGPPSNSTGADHLPSEPPSLQQHHTLSVALQRMHKSWDTMPPTVNRPYATTTMCHLVEMMAALGVYWKEFDRTYDRYRAEGNGFMLHGERVTDLGLMFSFRVYGKCRFERKRVIPVDEVKELCFGFVPTIYRETFDFRRLEFLQDHEQNIGTLQVATCRDISESLVMIGCNNNAVRCFKDSSKRTSHLFPVVFEILGMLSRAFHIKDSPFTYIPNPTPHHWNQRSLSLVKMMESYQDLVREALPGAARNASVLKRIKQHTREILSHHLTENFAGQLRFLTVLHAAINDCDEILTAKSHQDSNQEDEGKPETERQQFRRQMVLDVLRSHLQEVLKLLNDHDDHTGDSLAPHADGSPSSARSHDGQSWLPPPSFGDMHAASPDDRQQKFMEVYFEVIRRKVVPLATTSTDRRASIVWAPPGYGFRRMGTDRARASSTRVDNIKVMSPVPSLRSGEEENGIEMAALTDQSVPYRALPDLLDSDDEPPHEFTPGDHLSSQEVSHDDVWCTLIFRMICWLMLHDFNKLDVQLNKSELLGSRMPVYIA